MYLPPYSGCTTQILTWGPIADRSFRGLGRSVRSDRPSRSGPMYSIVIVVIVMGGLRVQGSD
jgi:hypothetical protein